MNVQVWNLLARIAQLIMWINSRAAVSERVKAKEKKKVTMTASTGTKGRWNGRWKDDALHENEHFTLPWDSMWEHCKFSIWKWFCLELARTINNSSHANKNKNYSTRGSRLRRTDCHCQMVTQTDWKKVELCAQNSFTCIHIPNYFVTEVKHMQMLRVFHLLFFRSRSLISPLKWAAQHFCWVFLRHWRMFCSCYYSGWARKHIPLNKFIED